MADPRVLVRRSFEVGEPIARVWDRLARPAEWPSWARHIDAVEMTPDGLVSPGAVGVVRLGNGMTSRFEVTQFVEGRRWLWSGRFLWLRVDYDHVLTWLAPCRTRVAFEVAVAGAGAGTLGRLFVGAYGRKLDAAIPNFLEEMESAVGR